MELVGLGGSPLPSSVFLSGSPGLPTAFSTQGNTVFLETGALGAEYLPALPLTSSFLWGK